MISNALQTGGNVIFQTSFFLGCILQYFWNLSVHSVSFPDDYIAIGADCDELGAQVEEYILSMDEKHLGTVVLSMSILIIKHVI